MSKNCQVNLPESMFNFSLSSVEDARKAFPDCREGEGLTPLDRTAVLREYRFGHYRVQLIKNNAPGKQNWVQITW
jgi:hypothetical protein